MINSLLLEKALRDSHITIYFKNGGVSNFTLAPALIKQIRPSAIDENSASVLVKPGPNEMLAYSIDRKMWQVVKLDNIKDACAAAGSVLKKSVAPSKKTVTKQATVAPAVVTPVKDKTLDQQESNYRRLLKSGVCRIHFTKVDKTDRVLIGTLNEELIDRFGSQDSFQSVAKKAGARTIRVFDLSVCEWRAFRVSSVITFSLIK
jgi:hypothetical protein